MAMTQLQSTAPEDQIRALVAAALTQRGATVQNDAPGSLVVDIGSVGMAYLAGGFRNKMKMPMRITVALNTGPGGSAVAIEIKGRGSGSGFASGGFLGAAKQKKAEAEWLQVVTDAIPGRAGSAPGMAPSPPSQGMAAAPPPPGVAAPPPPPGMAPPPPPPPG